LKLQQQAFYNLGNVQFQMAKQAKDLDGLEQGFDAGKSRWHCCGARAAPMRRCGARNFIPRLASCKS
jgi:hypothetical protein